VEVGGNQRETYTSGRQPNLVQIVFDKLGKRGDNITLNVFRAYLHQQSKHRKSVEKRERDREERCRDGKPEALREVPEPGLDSLAQNPGIAADE
jgi:hypothetical protein